MGTEYGDIDGHAVLDSLSDALFTVDKQGRLSYANQRLLDVLDTSDDALLGEPLAALEPFIDRGFDDLAAAIEDVRSGTHSDRRVEVEAGLPEATSVPVDARVTLFDESGVSGALVVLRQLRHEAQRFRAMFERHSAPMLLIDPDSGRIEKANRSAVEFYGYDADQLHEMSIQEINCLSPEQIARERERAKREDRNHFLFEHRLESGDVRDVEVHSSPVTIEGQTLLFSIIHDVTQREESRRELQVFREAVEQAGHSVIITDAAGVIEYVNSAFESVTGYESEEVVGRTPRVLKSGKQDDRFYDRLWGTVLSGKVWEAELVNQRKSGELYYVEHTIAPIVEDDEITNFVAVQKDITERKLKEKRLSELHRVLRHNVRNELAAIRGNAELLANELDGEAHEQLEWILERADALTETSEKITRLQQRIDHDYDGGAVCRPKTVIPELVADARELYPDAEIHTDVEPVVVRMGAATCRRLLFELLENAIVHNDREVLKVGITVETPGGDAKRVRLEVSDNGPGIPPQERTAVELDAEDPLKHGSGIGLSHIHWLVTDHGGEVEISDNDPRGSTVTLWLPRAESHTE
ncbi:sensor box histidine kinase (plasmid) [Natronomonas pharaonis DSM 2160]|uniref:Sensor box histidine kinase n=1 Tax=Natronomonas pharaonis (strain ATCC 35678 / DSM 2160 / CIP 103997 / JCM 8858 / NBRC 14720 / NCIMB 2260 / Gabara) TaxID=348780 RepID=Q3IM43_NATPD|nr:PAS domain S-box protein [Natronomonas pharaonis]CAI50820.1 sensor box histidine kinase [Natronomonas pharaonis DSM 2160]